MSYPVRSGSASISEAMTADSVTQHLRTAAFSELTVVPLVAATRPSDERRDPSRSGHRHNPEADVQQSVSSRLSKR